MRKISRLAIVALCAVMLGAPGASAQRHGGGGRGPGAGGMAVPRGPVGGGPHVPAGPRGPGVGHIPGPRGPVGSPRGPVNGWRGPANNWHGPINNWHGSGVWRGYGLYGRPWVGGGYYYQPWTGAWPWWPYGGYYPYWYYWNTPAYDVTASVHLHVTPDRAGVYVDGYYAGVVDDFDGTFQSLEVTPGGHTITLYLEGYQTFQRSVFATLGHHVSIRHTMQPLAPGTRSEPPLTGPPPAVDDD